HCATLTIFFFSNATAPPDIYSLSLHDALPIWRRILGERAAARRAVHGGRVRVLLSSHRARRRAAHLDRDLPDPALRRDLGVADPRRAAHAHDGTRRRADPRGRGAESKPHEALTRWWADVRSGADARSRAAASLPRSVERARARRLPDDRRRRDALAIAGACG